MNPVSAANRRTVSEKNSSNSVSQGAMNQTSIIVALDTADLGALRRLLEELRGVISFYKIGLELFAAHGWRAVESVRESGSRVFLDLKLHDIPHTVAKTASVICQYDIAMFTVHTLGGVEMMKAARKAVDETSIKGKTKPKVLGVTLLTSHTQETVSNELGIVRSIGEEVLHLAGLAKEAGLDGAVCSPQEAAILRKKYGKDFLLVTPGIRPEGTNRGDQKRTMTPQALAEQQIDYLVVGRPITLAPHPREAAQSMIRSLQ